MSGLGLDGSATAKEIEQELTPRVSRIKEWLGRTPILATILVGDDPSSATSRLWQNGDVGSRMVRL